MEPRCVRLTSFDRLLQAMYPPSPRQRYLRHYYNPIGGGGGGGGRTRNVTRRDQIRRMARVRLGILTERPGWCFRTILTESMSMEEEEIRRREIATEDDRHRGLYYDLTRPMYVSIRAQRGTALPTLMSRMPSVTASALTDKERSVGVVPTLTGPNDEVSPIMIEVSKGDDIYFFGSVKEYRTLPWYKCIIPTAVDPFGAYRVRIIGAKSDGIGIVFYSVYCTPEFYKVWMNTDFIKS